MCGGRGRGRGWGLIMLLYLFLFSVQSSLSDPSLNQKSYRGWGDRVLRICVCIQNIATIVIIGLNIIVFKFGNKKKYST